jgi:hypothetical protein
MARADKDMVTGVLACAFAVALAAWAYSLAAGPLPGGTFAVAWGAMAFGGLRFVRGLFALGQEERAPGRPCDGDAACGLAPDSSGLAVARQ